MKAYGRAMKMDLGIPPTELLYEAFVQAIHIAFGVHAKIAADHDPQDTLAGSTLKLFEAALAMREFIEDTRGDTKPSFMASVDEALGRFRRNT